MDYHGLSSFLSWIIIIFIMDYHHVPHVFPIFVAIEGGQKIAITIHSLPPRHPDHASVLLDLGANLI